MPVTEADPHKAWSDLTSLVDALLDVSPESRDALIAQLSAGNEVRRRELERLVRECEREPSLLSTPAPQRFAALFDQDVAHFPDALTERYRLERMLGRGGMASVYLAHDVKHARDVAIKVVHPAISTALGADRFLREIEIVAQLHHPHIMPLYDSGEAAGSVYYVMPYAPESSLRERLAREGSLPLEDVVVILRDVCDALAYAHRHGIVHRDIKPDNILLSGRHALVTDFGVATAASQDAGGRISGTALTLGTPAYMAPEQIAGDVVVDHRADIYSVGVLAYELLTGRPPFVREKREEILVAHKSTPPTPLTTVLAQLPGALAALVMKCLKKKPENRYQSAEKLVEDLESLSLPSGVIQREPERSRRRRAAVISVSAVAVSVLAIFAWQRFGERAPTWRARWAEARIERVTDFAGSEVDAAISPDGRFAAFLADRDSTFDAFVTRVGSGQFTNLTRGQFPQLFNEDVRNIGFSGDDAHVWIRVAGITSPASVRMLPAEGGEARDFLPTAVMAVWSPDGSRLAYHETTPGDPIYVADRNGRNAVRIFIAEPGVHSHHLAWSPDSRFLYFSHGLPPDEMDIWRILTDGSGRPERITDHNSRVAYPTLLDDHTLFYTATAAEGTGPWLYALDIAERIPHRVSTSVEHYLSIAAAAEIPGEPRRLVATVSNPAVSLWSVPVSSGIANESAAQRLQLPTARSAAPRFGDSSLYYLASLGGGDGLWLLSGGTSREVWKSTQGAVAGAGAVSPDGRRVCFPVRRSGRATLNCANADGSSPQSIAESLDVRGPATWSPDGKWIAIAAREGLSVRVFKIPIGGGAPVRLVDSVSFNPVWSPDGRYILYSGTPRARSAPLRAVTPDGKAYPVPELLVDRSGDSYRFLPNGREVVLKLGGFRHQDFWSVDLVTGRRRQLTALRPGESLTRFDVSPDGTRIVFERVRENSDVALIELPAR